jgi:uncharacterized membrane protein
MKEQKNLEKEQRKLRKITIYGYLYLFITIILKKLFKIFNIEIKRKRKNFDEIYQYNFQSNSNGTTGWTTSGKPSPNC